MKAVIYALLSLAVLFPGTQTALAQGRYIITYAGPFVAADGTLAVTQAIDFPAAVVADSAGGFYFSSTVQNRIYRVAVDGTLTLIAGGGPYGFSGDGAPAALSQMARPSGLALDSAGNLYIADSGNHRIRKIATDGVISTVAGSGSARFGGDGGQATSAQLNNPTAVAVDSGGNLFIADPGNQRVRKVSPDGVITTAAGNGVFGFSGDDGPATSAQLANPISVTVDSAGNLFIADMTNQRIRKVNAAGVITTVAGNGQGGFAGDGGPATEAVLANPSGVAVDSAGNLYIADSFTNRIRKVAADGSITTLAGDGFAGFAGDGRLASTARLTHPSGVAVGAEGKVFIADTGNHRIRSVTGAGVISTVAGIAISSSFGSDGEANVAQLRAPAGLFAFTVDNLFVADSSNHRIRRVLADGSINTVAGPGFPGFLGDGGLARSAQLSIPQGIVLDYTGSIYIADTGNHRVRKVTPEGVIRTVAGNGTRGFTGDGAAATAARLNAPTAVVVDFDGNLLIADTDNHRIRLVTAGGLIRTIAGNGTPGFSGDGAPAVLAQLDSPRGIAIDSAGNLYIADTGNDRIRIVSPGGLIRTFAGNGIQEVGADGIQATLTSLIGPTGLAVDVLDNIYIADTGSHRIRVVARDGRITTVAGNGVAGFSGDGYPPELAQLANPRAVTVDSAGNIYIADSGNQRIRKIVAVAP